MLNFFNEDVDFSHDSLLHISAWAHHVASLESYILHEVNYIFCSDAYLLNVNREYLDHDFYTDIITFDNSDQEGFLEADIFISIERVTDNAQLHQTTFFEELLRVMIHGILHLLGFDDHDEYSKAEMRSMEDKYINLYYREFHEKS
ncbi:MAG: rRNA maturation RNase YbeY [Cyclobacteriaceae bacterium]